MLDPQGPRRKGLVIETLVTTKLLGQDRRGARASRTSSTTCWSASSTWPTCSSGWAARGTTGDVRRRPEELVLAAEESHGVIALPHILDKDADPGLHVPGRPVPAPARRRAHAARLLRRHPGGAGRLRHRQPVDHDGGRQRHGAQGPDHGLAAQDAARQPGRARRSARVVRLLGRDGLRPAGQRERAAAPQRRPAVHRALRGHGAALGHRAEAEVLLPAAARSGARPGHGARGRALLRRAARRGRGGRPRPSTTTCWRRWACSWARSACCSPTSSSSIASASSRARPCPRLRDKLGRRRAGRPGRAAGLAARARPGPCCPGADALPALRGPLAPVAARWARELPRLARAAGAAGASPAAQQA